MNANEKANDLVNQYRMILMDENTDCGNEILCTIIAKKCALITIDEVLQDDWFIEKEHSEVRKEFWNEVKIEVERL